MILIDIENSQRPEPRILRPYIDDFHYTINAFNIWDAYKDLNKNREDIEGFVWILDVIADGWYSIEEAIIAGVLLTHGIEGRYKSGGKSCKGVYAHINGEDFVVLPSEETVLFDPFFNEDSEFIGKNKIVYKLKNKKATVTTNNSHLKTRTSDDQEVK